MRGLKIYDVVWSGHHWLVAANSRAEAAEAIGCSAAHVRAYGEMVQFCPAYNSVLANPGQPFHLRRGELRKVTHGKPIYV